MINVSNEFIAVMNENRKFRQVAEITLLDGTVLNLTEHDFTPHNNYVSDGSGASGIPLGVAIGRSIQIEIINEEEKYSSYDFYGAEIVLYLTYKLSETTERIEMGTFTVTSPATYGDTIIMNALDHMHKADKSYATSLAFPATAQSVLVDACSSCDIPLLSTSFLNDDFVIDSIPSSQYTFREVIGFVAMIAAGNARINRQGYLEIITYDFSYLGLILDGGTFEPWTEGNAIDGGTFEFLETEEVDGGDYGKRNYHVFADFKNLKVDTDSVTITGLKTTTQGDTATVLLEGEEGYVLELKNPLFEGKEASALSLIGPVMIGGQMRKFEADAICYPLAEFMDPCIVVDRKGNAYPTVLTDVNFVFFGFTTLRNSAESSSTLGNKYPSNYVSAIVEANKLVQKEKTDRELALEQLNKKLSNSSGLYVTTETQEDGSTIYYMHDKQTLAGSEIVWKYTAQAFGVSVDGGETYPYGFSATGETIANLLYAVGINADYIKTGAISIVDEQGKIIFSIDKDTSEVVINADAVKVGSQSVTEVVGGLQDQIDGTLGNYSGAEVPTLDNYPANEWTTDLLKDAAIGSLYFVNSEGGDYAGFTYRFEKLSDGTYQWALLKDTEVTQALKELEDLKKNLSENYSTTVEMTSAIEKSATSVKTEVSKTYTTKNELTGLEEVVKSNTTAIESNAKEIELRAVESDITGNYLIAKINLDTTTAKITAKNIVLEGLVTANSNFKVLEDGSIEAVNATLNGSLISYSSDATCYMHNGEMRLYPEKVADPSSYEGDDYSVLSHDKFVLNGSAYINDLKAGPIGHKVMLSELTNGFYGLVDSSGSNSNWIRTTSNGLIPYQSGGSGSIGTSGWEFNNGHFKNIHTGAINFGSYGAGVLWDTTFGQAGLYSLSNGGGLYLMTISSEVTGGWYSSVLLADSSGVNLVPKTGGTFTGNLATDGTFNATGNIISSGNIQCANRIKTQGTYDTTTTAAANMVIPSTYWTARSTASSRRYKHDIVKLQGELNSEKLLNVPVRQYKYNLDYISEKDQRYNVDIPGFIAEELLEHYPIAVEIIDGQVEDWNHRMIIPPMLDLIQKLHRRITELEGRIKP